jgi:PAS domain S-box-containing protein/putative nucleotidyltransferase with HDIG domain
LRALGGARVVASAYSGEPGSRLYVDVVHEPLADATGAVVGVAVWSFDATERETVERNLRDTQERFQMFFNAVPDGIVVIGPDGCVTAANQSQVRLYRYGSADDLIGINATLLVAPSCRDRAAQNMQRRLNGEDVPLVEYEVLRKDGTTFYAEVQATILRNQDGAVSGYICATRDVTERKGAEAALRESEEHYRELFDGVVEGVFRTSLEGRVLRYNQALAEMLGYDPEEDLTVQLLDAAHEVWADPEDRSRFTELVREQGVVRGHECEFLRKDASRTWVSLSARLVPGREGEAPYYEGFVQDISARRLAERRDEERSHFLEELLMAIPVPVFCLDATLHYLDANEAYLAYLGLSKGELLDKTVFDVWPAELAKRFDASDRELLAHPERPIEDGVELPLPDGTLVNIVTHKAVFSDIAGRTGGIVGVNLDVTDIREAEVRLAASAAKLKLTLEGAVTALGATTEMRDPYTSGHQRRVAEIACAIAFRLGWDEDRLESLRVAAVLHDIGKILVPAEILSKPARLNNAEMALIREHAGAGADIVGPIGFDLEVAETIRQHHERLDGSGYPAKLRGGEILPGARILAIADVVEAMISHRPYRPALRIEAAMAEIEDGAGSRYDAAACDAAISLFRDGGFKLSE